MTSGLQMTRVSGRIAPKLKRFMSLEISLGSPIDLGIAPEGHRRIVPIIGGYFSGDGFKGTVLPGGLDNQVLESETVTRLHAIYVLELEDGGRIYVDNSGVRSGHADDIRALIAGQPVKSSSIYFRTAPHFSSGRPEWSWLSGKAFVAAGIRKPDAVLLDVYEVS